MQIGTFKTYTIHQMMNMDKKFYQYMGRFFGSRSVAAELGGPIWDDDDKVWIIALDKQVVIGFCAFIPNKSGKKATLKSAYVVKAYRSQGIYTHLFGIRMGIMKGMEIRECISTTTEDSEPTHLKYGFKYTINRGKYKVYEWRDGK